MSWVSVTTQSLISSLARFIICSRLSKRTSDICSTETFASHGPTLSTVSIAAAMMAVSALSRLEGATIFPSVRSFADFSSMSILPILPDLWSSLSSKFLGKSPSVWPKMAPMTSCFSTTPSTTNFASIMYFVLCFSFEPIMFTSISSTTLAAGERTP